MRVRINNVSFSCRRLQELFPDTVLAVLADFPGAHLLPKMEHADLRLLREFTVRGTGLEHLSAMAQAYVGGELVASFTRGAGATICVGMGLNLADRAQLRQRAVALTREAIRRSDLDLLRWVLRLGLRFEDSYCVPLLRCRDSRDVVAAFAAVDADAMAANWELAVARLHPEDWARSDVVANIAEMLAQLPIRAWWPVMLVQVAVNQLAGRYPTMAILEQWWDQLPTAYLARNFPAEFSPPPTLSPTQLEEVWPALELRPHHDVSVLIQGLHWAASQAAPVMPASLFEWPLGRLTEVGALLPADEPGQLARTWLATAQAA